MTFTTKKAAREAYEAVFGRNPNPSMDKDQIAALLRTRAEAEAAAQARQAEEDKASEEADAARAQRIADRGDKDEFAKRDGLTGDDRDMADMLWGAMSAVRNFEKSKDRFDKSMAQDPAYALSWSLDLFQATGELRVANEVIHGFEAGATAQSLREAFTRNAVRFARYSTCKSTSQTSNLMEEAIAAAYAKFVDRGL